jgi:hypothetical protein
MVVWHSKGCLAGDAHAKTRAEAAPMNPKKGAVSELDILSGGSDCCKNEVGGCWQTKPWLADATRTVEARMNALILYTDCFLSAAG